MARQTTQLKDRRIDEIEPVEGGTFMVHLKYGFRLNDDGCHTFGADNIKQVCTTMEHVRPCHCAECADFKSA